MTGFDHAVQDLRKEIDRIFRQASLNIDRRARDAAEELGLEDLRNQINADATIKHKELLELELTLKGTRNQAETGKTKQIKI